MFLCKVRQPETLKHPAKLDLKSTPLYFQISVLIFGVSDEGNEERIPKNYLIYFYIIY